MSARQIVYIFTPAAHARRRVACLLYAHSLQNLTDEGYSRGAGRRRGGGVTQGAGRRRGGEEKGRGGEREGRRRGGEEKGRVGEGEATGLLQILNLLKGRKLLEMFL